MSRILVVSPHLDDAVFSLGEHILSWINQGNEIQILNVFTSFKSDYIPQYSKHLLDDLGVNNMEYEKIRKKEDHNALALIHIMPDNLDFIDGGFRYYENRTIYPSSSDLFSGEVHRNDEVTIEEVSHCLQKYKTYDKVLVPYGVGNHADHLICRKGSEVTFPNTKIYYYFDQTYSANWRNWNFKNILALFRVSSIKNNSQEKIILERVYKSQYPLLKKMVTFNCPEIVTHH